MSSASPLKKQFEQSLSQRFDFAELSQKFLIPRITHLAFSPEDVLELSDQGFMPMVSLSPQQHVVKEIEVSMPLLRAKQIRWSMSWQGDETISTLLIKLGTGGRTNHCHLILSIFEENKHVATAHQQGTMVEDGQWTAFHLDFPLFPGKLYHAQLCSPDADNAANTLFLWVTVEYTREITFLTHNLIDLHYYGLLPITGELPTDSFNRALEITFPILQGQTLQWSLNIERTSTSILYLKLGTGGKLNRCHLVLSIFKVQKNTLGLVSTSILPGHLAQDNRWTPLTLEHPLAWGHYICRLHSPDTDNTNNTLFVCLSSWGSENYVYLPSSTVPPLDAQIRMSILLPLHHHQVFNPYLRECLDSVVTQTYPSWELCIALEDQIPWVEAYQHKFPNQIKLIYGYRTQLLNLALTIATGEYLAFLHPSDLLSSDALTEAAKNMTSETDMFYSDEDQINQGGVYYGPYFKPQWAPEMLKGIFYTGQLALYRTSVLRSIGGFREEFEGEAESPSTALWKIIGNFREDPYPIQLWEMTLRFTQRTQKIQHLAKILYHRRAQPSWLNASNCQVIQTVLDQEKYGGYVTLSHSHCLIHYPVHHTPLVSVIIPSKDQTSLLAHCLETFLQTTHYDRWELIIVDNGSHHLETFKLFEHYQTRLGHRFKVVHYDIPFNFSKLVNRGVEIAQGEVLLLLNNDIEILAPSDWLEEMIGFAQHPHIACVGCKLLYPQDDTFQHAGLICGIGGIANPGHKHFPAQSAGYFNRLAIVANYSAITGACLMVKHTLWDEIGGFDEHLTTAFNDVDFCLKLLHKGLRHVVLPQVVFYHHESKSRGLENTWAKKKRLHQEEQRMKHRWGNLLKNDPFYNPHLTRVGEDFSLDLSSFYYDARKKNWIRRLLQI